MKRRAPSELEGCVLGVIGIEQPVTAYAIGSIFLNSPSPQWSGSAGAIYPLVQRLERAKLIRATRRVVGRRPSKVFSLMASGRKVFETWLGPPVPDWVAGVPPDPLRTRVRFLELCAPRTRIAFVRKVRASAAANLKVIQADCRVTKPGGGVRYLIARGALASMKARCHWLRTVEKELQRQKK